MSNSSYCALLIRNIIDRYCTSRRWRSCELNSLHEQTLTDEKYASSTATYINQFMMIPHIIFSRYRGSLVSLMMRVKVDRNKLHRERCRRRHRVDRNWRGPLLSEKFSSIICAFPCMKCNFFSSGKVG